MDALEKLKAAIKRFISGPPPKDPPSLVSPATPSNLDADFEAARKLAEKIKADLEARLNQEFIMVPLGKVTIKPCDFPACKMRRAAQWN